MSQHSGKGARHIRVSGQIDIDRWQSISGHHHSWPLQSGFYPVLFDIMVVNHAAGLFSCVFFPGLFGEPFSGSNPLHIFIADIKYATPVATPENISRNAGATSSIGQCLSGYIGPSAIGLINHLQPITNAAHSIVGNMADK